MAFRHVLNTHCGLMILLFYIWSKVLYKSSWCFD